MAICASSTVSNRTCASFNCSVPVESQEACNAPIRNEATIAASLLLLFEHILKSTPDVHGA